jgi:hypothetical protein
MRGFVVLCGLFCLFLMPAAAQSTSPGPAAAPPASSSTQDTQQSTQQPDVETLPQPPPPPVAAPYELSGGYNLRVFTQTDNTRIGFSGGYGEFEYKILSRISAAAEVSASYRNQGVNGDLSLYSFMVGPQIYPFKHRRKYTPFAQVLFGEGIYRASFPAYAGFPAEVRTNSAFTWEGGGGLDWTHSNRWAIRIVQVDYGQTKFFGSQSQTNYRISIGVVYRFGQK